MLLQGGSSSSCGTMLYLGYGACVFLYMSEKQVCSLALDRRFYRPKHLIYIEIDRVGSPVMYVCRTKKRRERLGEEVCEREGGSANGGNLNGPKETPYVPNLVPLFLPAAASSSLKYGSLETRTKTQTQRTAPKTKTTHTSRADRT